MGGAVPRMAWASFRSSRRPTLFSAPSMLLLCWNLAGRLKRMQEQADVIEALGADVICLQEVTPLTGPAWRERLEGAGYRVGTTQMPRARESSRPLGVLIAAREVIQEVPVADVPW